MAGFVMLIRWTKSTHRKGKVKMNAAVLKWLTLSMFGLVVCSALLLAAAVKLNLPPQQQRLMTRATPALLTASYHRVLQTGQAASAALLRTVTVR